MSKSRRSAGETSADVLGLLLLQVCAGRVSRYSGTKRPTTTCCFAPTAPSPPSSGPAARRNTAPASARRPRRTSTAGERRRALFSGRNPERCLSSPLRLHLLGSSLSGVPQRRPWSLRRAFNFQRHSRKCHLLPFDRFSHGAQRQPNASFTLYEKKGTRRLGGASAGLRCRGDGGEGGRVQLQSVWFFSRDNKCRGPPLALPLLNNSPGPSRTDKQAARFIVNKKKVSVYSQNAKGRCTAFCGI